MMAIAQRLDIRKVDPDAYKPMLALEKYIHAGTLDEALLGIIRYQASQINGCAFCLEMHGREAHAAGVSKFKLDVLAGWREAASLFTEREQAALVLTEEVTRISEHGVSDSTWQCVQTVFSEKETVELLMAICAINVWNRLAVSVHLDLPLAN